MIAIRQATTADELTEVQKLMRAFIAWHRDRHHREAELIDRYFDAEAFEQELATLPGDYAPPAGRLLLADCDNRVAGCVALRDLGDGACEMKRMFVYPEFHGQGVGKALGEAIVAEGALAGYSLMRLDTGSRQIEAQTLYRRLGFTVIPPYYDLPDDLAQWLVFMERELK
jgi:GNAT superfamily N-acetyltransferase